MTHPVIQELSDEHCWVCTEGSCPVPVAMNEAHESVRRLVPEQSIGALQGGPAGAQRLEDEAAGGWECVAASVEALQVLVSNLRSTGCDEDAALASLVRPLPAEGLAMFQGI